jgi:phosphoribosylaminoimidazole-succinocarboxamide synthase
MSALYQTHLDGLHLINRGKVRDIYAIDDAHMLVVTTDRLSAFDVVLPQPIPGKGEVLTRVSNFWFARTADLVPNQLTGIDVADVVPDAEQRRRSASAPSSCAGSNRLPVEAIVRGYLIGSGWKDYQRAARSAASRCRRVCARRTACPRPIYTPSTKAAIGDHDENVDFAHTANLIGAELAEQVRDLSMRIYLEAAAYALTRGIIIADTKFEFGLDQAGRLHLIDEVLTPDSSRFWPADQYRPGISPPSFDKQFVRDYLETLDWDKTPPGPELPRDIIDKTAAKYAEAEARLTRSRSD